MKKNRPVKSFVKSLVAPMTKSSRERKKEKKYLGRLNSLDDQAKETALRCREYTLLNPEKLYAFIQAIRYIEKNAISGDIVECGVWRGGAIMAAALTLKQLNVPERTCYLYDTFAGMSRPTDKDRPMPGTGDFGLRSSGQVIDVALRVGGDEITLGGTRLRDQLFNSADYFL